MDTLATLATLATHHTLLPQGANNPGVVFDWHTDTAQENDSSDRGSGKALLTAIYLDLFNLDEQ